MTDPLDRFVAAQHGTYADALAELQRGHKESHWMWFVFPQLRGLGRSDMALFYGIADLDEARAYLAHDLLGARYRACAAALLEPWPVRDRHPRRRRCAEAAILPDAVPGSRRRG